MADFFKKLTGDKGKKSSSKNENSGGGIKNPFANINIGGPKKFAGQGKSLGGGQPGEVISISLPDQGSLGMKLEETRQGGTIISSVRPNTQAASAGLQRGDIVCLPRSEGTEEMRFDQCMAWAASDLRPFAFDVRRIKGAANYTSSSNSTTTASPRRGEQPQQYSSAEDNTRRQAVIAAAEARDKAHRAKTKQPPATHNHAHTKHAFLSTTERKKLEALERERLEEMEKQGPQSETSRLAVVAAKQHEASTVRRMGFNPYEVGKMSGDQAKNATVDVKHGSVAAVPEGRPATTSVVSTSIATNKNNHNNTTSTFHQSIDEAFDEAFATVVSSGNIKSVSTMRKLVINATTKGQKDPKFRRVRLSNDKIKELIVEVPGALDLMMLFGFLPHEEGDETFLVLDSTGPEWMEMGLERMERYEKQQE